MCLYLANMHLTDDKATRLWSKRPPPALILHVGSLMCVLVCVHSSKCGLVQGRKRRGQGTSVTRHVQYMYRSKLTHNPLLPLLLLSPPYPSLADRKRVNLSGPEWWVGKSCPVRVIQSNYPPSVFVNNGLTRPPAPHPSPLLLLSCLVSASPWQSCVRRQHHARPWPFSRRPIGAKGESLVTRFRLTVFSSFSSSFFLTPRTQTWSTKKEKGGEIKYQRVEAGTSGECRVRTVYDHRAVTCIPFHTQAFLRNCL